MASWRLLLDENVDPKVATYLEKEGLLAEHVRDTLGQGADDEDDVLPYARERELIVVTGVKDFGDLSSEDHAGVIHARRHDARVSGRRSPHLDRRCVFGTGRIW